MTTYVTGGPPRFQHQKRGLAKMISTGGVAALLFDPGTGKTATVLDYAGLLALKSPTEEARVLVVCPLVAVDTWVTQAERFMSPQVGYWAEALSGSLLDRAEALAARGGNPYDKPLYRGRPTPPAGWFTFRESADFGYQDVACLRCGAHKSAIRESTLDRWWAAHLDEHPEYISRGRPRMHHPDAVHHDRSIMIGWRQPAGVDRPMSATQGPRGVAGPRVVLEVINIDTLTSRSAVGGNTMADVMLGAIRRFDPDLGVVDESHKIKAVRGNASLLLARVAKHVKRRVILTGTVAPHGPLDVFAQWRFLEPYAFGEVLPDGTKVQATISKFQQQYVIYGGWNNREVKGYQNLDHMQKVMSANAVVVRKSEALDLPPTMEVEIAVELSPAEKKAYADMKKQLVVELAPGRLSSVNNLLVQMLRLRQITSGHLPEDGGPVQVIGMSKAQTIRSLVEDTLIGEKRIVIFALFSHEIAMLAGLLRQGGTAEVMVIEGDTPTEERRRLRERFGSDDPTRIVLVAQIKTLSLAVNELVTANHAVFASLSQQRDDIEQAKARLDRTGQTRPVTFHFCIAPGTVDEIILKSHRERTSLEDALLKHIQDLA